MTVPLNRLHPDDRDALLAKWWEGDSIGNGEDSDRQHGMLCDALIKKFVKIEPFHEGPCPSGVFSYGLGSYGYDIRVGYKFKVFGTASVLKPMTDAAAAWVAGILDGEGWLGLNNTKGVRGRPLPRITVGMTHKPTVEMLCDLTGVGYISERKPQKPTHNPLHVWNVHRVLHVQQLLTRVLPFMVTKREKAYELISMDLGETGHAIVDPKDMDDRCFTDLDLTPAEGEAAECAIIPPNSFALAEAVEYLEIPRSVLVIGIGKSSYARTGIILNVTPVEPEWRGKLTLEISNTTPLPVKVYPNEGICQLVFFKAPIECLVSYADKKGKYQDQKGLTLPFVVKTSG